MIRYEVFKQGRVRCAPLTNIISHGDKDSLALISDAVRLALSLGVPGTERDGENSYTYMSVCGHCLGNIRGQCCVTCRMIENMSRKALSKAQRVSDISSECEAGDVFLTAALIFGFMKVQYGWSTNSWVGDVLKDFDQIKLEQLYQELGCLNPNGAILEHSMISVGDNVCVWAPSLTKRLFNDKISTFVSSYTPANGIDINVYFSDNEVALLDNMLGNMEPTIDITDHDKTCTSLGLPVKFGQSDAHVVIEDNHPRPTTFNMMHRGYHFRNFMSNAVLLPVKRQFKNPVHQIFLLDYSQMNFEFRFDTTTYEPKRMISDLLFHEQFLNFVKSTVPSHIDSLEDAFAFINKNLLIDC